MYKSVIQVVTKSFLFSTTKPCFQFRYGSYMIPHPAKAHKGGEDAYYVSQNVLAVADGVGGWADQGIDPGLYSKKLCELIGDLSQRQVLKYIQDPKQLLIDAVSLNKQLGTTTACIATLHPQSGLLRMYYIGDSVYALVRKEKIEIAGDQQKYFNCPFQVGSQGDHPSLGVYNVYQHSEFDNKDVIVIATDGVWDNTHLKQLHQSVYTKSELPIRAQKLAQVSSHNSLTEGKSVPFYEKAKKAGYRLQNSGKPDDITVILAQIIKKQSEGKII